jgi:hypothetical protein
MPLNILIKTISKMRTTTRLNLEIMITENLNQGEKGLAEAIQLATLEFDYTEDVVPHLEEAFYMAGAENTDKVLKKWSGILNEFAKVA